MPKALVSSSYKKLVEKINKEISQTEFFVRNRTVQGYWKIGKYIAEHLLENKERANYGATLYEQLGKDIDRDVSTLQRCVKFYRAYPIQAIPPELTWEHYRNLITVKDVEQRKKLEQKIISENWNSSKLRDHLAYKREIASLDNKPIIQLPCTRGKLNTFFVTKSNKALMPKGPLAIDLGFRLQDLLPTRHSALSEKSIVHVEYDAQGQMLVKESDALKDELFTYQAVVEKVVDGDTLIVSFAFHPTQVISQKLRLKGIDCPEMNTEEGKRAKRFVETRLKNCQYVIVKTYKDRTDKYDRYLADVFYQSDEADVHVVAQQGVYLNQELLNERLAAPYK